MIQYKFPEEKDFLLNYAKKLGNQQVEDIILAGEVKSSDEANALSEFFWKMTDQVVIDKDAGEVVAGQEDLEAWNEYVFESIRAYLRNNGYEKEWDALSFPQ